MVQLGSLSAQPYGPNNPGSTGTSGGAGMGTNWNNTGNIVSSNNVYSTSAGSTLGVTRYLTASNFGFAIPTGENIAGIRVEVERSTASTSTISLLNGWTTGLSKTISAGTSRCLVVIASTENGDGATDIASMSYGGQTMTQVGEFSVNDGGSFWNRIEIWILKEAGIAAASGTTISVTTSAISYVENTEVYSAAVFQGVDQYNPIFQIQNSSVSGNVVPYQLASALSTLAGGVSVTAIACGNRPSAAPAPGGTDTYTINSSFTEGTDIYFANPSFTTSGASLQTAYKLSASAGFEQPTFTFAGTANRQIAVAFSMRGAAALDNSVRLGIGGSQQGNDYAQSTVSWPTTDGYAVYGGPTDLWGTTWTRNDINNNNFSVFFSAIRQSGAINVDHIRVTVWTTPSPIELAYFHGETEDDHVLLTWETQTEINNEYFTIEYSPDGATFLPVESVPGAGNSKVPIQYSTTFNEVRSKTSYFRLKQTDFDGQFTYSNVIAVDTRDLLLDLSMFPNPASNTISVLNAVDVDIALRIVSQTGVVVLDLPAQRSFQDIDIANIPNGLYLVELRRGYDRYAKKLLISH